MAIEPKATREQAKIRPRIGRWEVSADGAVQLIASRCPSCGETVFPERPVCPRCHSRSPAEVRLDGNATLHSYTVVHQLPAGFVAPLVVGYGEFPGAVLVLAPVDVPVNQLRRGLPLALHLGITRVDEDGEAVETYRFRMAAAAQPA